MCLCESTLLGQYHVNNSVGVSVCHMTAVYCHMTAVYCHMTTISLSLLSDVPGQLRLQAMQAVMLLMPDENREALLTLLLFLKRVAEHSGVNQVHTSSVVLYVHVLNQVHTSSVVLYVHVLNQVHTKVYSRSLEEVF